MGKRIAVAIAILLLGATVSQYGWAQAEPSPITAVIRLKARVSMESLAHQVQDPMSPHYQRFFTSSEIRVVAAPSDLEYRMDLERLRASGLEIVSESPTHLWVSVQATPQVFEKIFSISLKPLKHGQDRPPLQIHIPKPLEMVAGIAGLDDARKAVQVYAAEPPNPMLRRVKPFWESHRPELRAPMDLIPSIKPASPGAVRTLPLPPIIVFL